MTGQEWRLVTLRLRIPVDVAHVNLAVELSNAMHASEPILVRAGDHAADAFVDDFAYKVEGGVA